MSSAGERSTSLSLAPTLAPFPGDIRHVMDRVASLGFRFVQLSATQPGLRPRDLDRSARRDLVATLRRRELLISGLDAWIPASHFTDSERADRAVTAAVAAIELAGDLGRCPVSLTLPHTAENHDEKQEVHTDHQMIEAIVHAAHRVGVPIADHRLPVPDRTWNELIGIGIDPAAWLATGDNPVDGVNRHSNHLISARLSDLMTTGMRGPIGTRDGRLDVASYAVSLTVAGYERPVVLDARQWPHPWSDIKTAAANWKSVLPQVGPMGL